MSLSVSARVAWPIYVVLMLVSALVAGTLSFVFLGDSLAALGIPDPGVLTTVGLPSIRAAAWILASLATGSFMFSAFLIPPNGKELHGVHLTVDGHIAGRTGAWASAGLALIGLFMIPLVLSDISGTPLTDVLFSPEMWAMALSRVADAKIWLLVAFLAAAVAACGLLASSWSSQVCLLYTSDAADDCCRV